MKLVCMSDKFDDTVQYWLTIGKTYEIVRESKCHYFVKNDKDHTGAHKKNIFISIKEYRKLKLEKLENIE